MTVNGHTNGHSNGFANGHTNGHTNGLHVEEKPFLPEGFLYGFSTAAAQIEGGGEEAEKASGRGDSIWDEFCRQPGKVDGCATIYRTCNHYELYKEDIALMKKLGANSYRFSISWPRLLPEGAAGSRVNEKGVAFYNGVIDECLKHGLTPFITLYHWDLPLALWEAYGGWLDKSRIVPDFTAYSKLCFSLFGDRVKYWLTFNEPWCTAVHGHYFGAFAPGHKSNTEPWIVGHSQLLAHAAAVDVYRKEFKEKQGGLIGITLNGDWTEPYDNSPENIKAAQEKMDFAVGWFADPIYLDGEYPKSMQKKLGDRLPKFTPEEKELVKGSSDFYGCNCYTTNLIRAGNGDEVDGGHEATFQRADGTFIGTESQLAWLRDVGWGFRKHLAYLWNRYHSPIYITENGYAPKGEDTQPKEEAIHDAGRVHYYRGYLDSVRKAVEEDGVQIKSYYAWSFLDNFEWNSGFAPRFGCVYTDYKTFERTPKDSARFVIDFFQKGVKA